jgi:hypothetical protein
MYHQLSSTIFKYHQLSSTIFHYHQLYCTIINYLQLSWIIINYQLPTSIINYHQLSSTIIVYHQLWSTIINYHQLTSTIFNYHQLYLTTINYLQLYSTITSYQQLSLTTNNYLQLYSTIINSGVQSMKQLHLPRQPWSDHILRRGLQTRGHGDGSDGATDRAQEKETTGARSQQAMPTHFELGSEIFWAFTALHFGRFIEGASSQLTFNHHWHSLTIVDHRHFMSNEVPRLSGSWGVQRYPSRRRCFALGRSRPGKWCIQIALRCTCSIWLQFWSISGSVRHVLCIYPPRMPCKAGNQLPDRVDGHRPTIYKPFWEQTSICTLTP